MRKVHIYADITGDWRPSDRHVAEEHAEERSGEKIIGVNSIDTLLSTLNQMAEKATVLDAMDFHTHGSPGSLSIGSEHLNFDTLGRFRGEQFPRIFRPGAVIELSGCNVAEGPEGELFLAEFGSIFLKNNGGRVKASTGAGLADPLFTGDVYHPTGRWLTAQVRPGGGVTLINCRHLLPHLIRNAIERRKRDIQQMEQGTLSAARRGNIQRAKEALHLATQSIGPSTSQPSYFNVYLASRQLAMAVQALTLSMAR